MLRTLGDTPISTLTRAFNRAFADYAVSFEMTDDRLTEMLRRRGVRFDLSVGVFEADDLVGFTFNGFDEWDGVPTGYDSGTGVVPEARGRGLSSEMLDATKQLFRGAGARQYLLEVLQSNEAAIHVYEKAGFHAGRSLLCYQLDRAPRRSRAYEILVAPPLWKEFASWWDSRPSWQNGIASVARAGDPYEVLVARIERMVAGYAIVFPQSGDLAQLAVARPHRRVGIGTALVAEAKRRSQKPLRILNIDADDDGTNNFVLACGAKEIARQYEMTLDL